MMRRILERSWILPRSSLRRSSCRGVRCQSPDSSQYFVNERRSRPSKVPVITLDSLLERAIVLMPSPLAPVRSLLLRHDSSNFLPLLRRQKPFTSFLHRTMTTTITAGSTTTPVQHSIETKLAEKFTPSHLQVINESHRHNVPLNSETHFQVILVSEQFGTVPSPVARHRLVHSVLDEELKGPVHALSLVLKTPAQWQALLDKKGDDAVEPTPNCRGGDGSLPKKQG